MRSASKSEDSSSVGLPARQTAGASHALPETSSAAVLSSSKRAAAKAALPSRSVVPSPAPLSARLPQASTHTTLAGERRSSLQAAARSSLTPRQVPPPASWSADQSKSKAASSSTRRFSGSPSVLRGQPKSNGKIAAQAKRGDARAQKDSEAEAAAGVELDVLESALQDAMIEEALREIKIGEQYKLTSAATLTATCEAHSGVVSQVRAGTLLKVMEHRVVHYAGMAVGVARVFTGAGEGWTVIVAPTGDVCLDPDCFQGFHTADVKEVPEHLWLGIQLQGFLHFLKLFPDSSARHMYAKLIEATEQMLKRKPSEFLQGILDKRIAFEKNWPQPSCVVAYRESDQYRWDDVFHLKYMILACDGYDFLDGFLKTYIFARYEAHEKSYCEFLLEGMDRTSNSATFVNQATTFVSHAQREPLELTLSALVEHLNERDGLSAGAKRLRLTSKTFFWIDYFCLRQLVKGQFNPSWIACVITTLRNTLMVVDDWEQVTVSTRLWCTFEIAQSAAVNALQASMPRGNHRPGLGGFLQRCAKVSVVTAETTDEEAQKRIAATMLDAGAAVDRILQVSLTQFFTSSVLLDLEEDSSMRAWCFEACPAEKILDAVGAHGRDILAGVRQLRLKGDVPPEFFDFAASVFPLLRVLRMRMNGTAVICTQASRMAKLQTLDLTGSQFRKISPVIAELRQLRVLIADFCDHLQELPKALGKCRFLQELSCQDCLLLKTLPEEMGSCQLLRKVNLFGCKKLASLPSRMARNVALQWLSLGATTIHVPKDLASSLPSWRGLQVLIMSGMTLTELPRQISYCTALRCLDMQACFRLAQLPKEMQACKSLEDVNFSHTRITSLPKELGMCLALKTLTVEFCTYLATLPEELGACKSLEVLSAQGCDALISIPWQLALCVQLHLLDIRRCTVLEQLHKSFEQHSRLTVIKTDPEYTRYCGT
eukprot:TRINITY_DN9802_c0_g4_i1.p1 TRINITY_DN9802_c0_g4~~TRINITY_DN9802_c0_g4_i1.p1  ORF type:complete len:941 (+),score=124.18 TRINITY_DN9802_c0_g4_i1:95-2917(+)